MKRVLQWAALLAGLASINLSSQAWHIYGKLGCPDGSTISGIAIKIAGTSQIGPFSATVVTDTDGNYYSALPDYPGVFTATVDKNTLPPGTYVVGNPAVQFEFTWDYYVQEINWELGGSLCSQGCWFTGGGAKIDSILGIPAADKGPKNSFGGNVYPGCSPTAGDGGNWNHVARDLKRHFKGTSIQVVRCGNVTEPPPPGSTSPVTPYNFIEFQGTGTCKGIQGNKEDFGTVTFFARCEDRNEPGTKPANAGAGIDRYYLRVKDSAGNTILLINGSANPDVVAPVEITDGNFQLHASSCDNPPTF